MESETRSAAASRQAEALAQRLEQGARALADFARTLTDAEWRTPFGTTDKRTIGVIVHHVASIYPLEIQLAQVLATGKPVTGVTWDAVAEGNGNARVLEDLLEAARRQESVHRMAPPQERLERYRLRRI